MIVVTGTSFDDVFDGVAVSSLRHEVAYHRLTRGVGYASSLKLKLFAGYIVKAVDGVSLRHSSTRHLVQRRYPLERHHIVQIVFRMIGIDIIADKGGCGTQGNFVNTHLGSILGIVLSIVGAVTGHTEEHLSIDVFIGVHGTSINSPSFSVLV